MILLPVLGIIFLTTLFLACLYRIVPPSEAHFVVSPGKTMVCSSDAKILNDFADGENKGRALYGGRWYFYIPVIRTVRIMSIAIRELNKEILTYEREGGRYHVTYSLKYRVRNVERAAETYTSDEDLQKQLDETLSAAVTAATIQYSVTEVRAQKRTISDATEKELGNVLEEKWGLELIDFVLVDFKDTPESTIISDISRRREVEINSQTRQNNAQRIREARIAEAEADEKSRQREIERDENVARREEDKKKNVAVNAKSARENELEVTRVETVTTAQIAKERAKVEAEQRLQVEEIIKDQKRLEGEGDRLRAEERAKGEAASVKESGLAEAAVLKEKQKALSEFDDNAVRALVAEKLVAMQEKVGVAGAAALKEADVRIFAGGGESGRSGFDVGRLIGGLSVSDESSASAVLNRIARPHDLGLDLTGLVEKVVKGKKAKGGKGEVVKEV